MPPPGGYITIYAITYFLRMTWLWVRISSTRDLRLRSVCFRPLQSWHDQPIGDCQ